MKLKALLDSMQINSFVPMRYKTVMIQGKTQKQLLPAINNLLFTHTTRELLDDLKCQLEGRISFRYVIDKATKAPAIVLAEQMEQLIYLTHLGSTLKVGDRRVMVSVNHMIVVATAHINTSLLTKIDD